LNLSFTRVISLLLVVKSNKFSKTDGGVKLDYS